ncbi:hypothetical protein H0H93_015263 [Arthromyces matolae]|nr:hypothetical protein H0H93_015263 [Arthromyces matolae]
MPDKKDKLKKSSQGGSSKKTSQGDSSKKPTMPVGRQLYAVTVDKQKEDACNFLKTIPDKNLTDIMSKRPGTLYSANEKLDRSWTPGVRQTTGHRVDLQGFTRSGANLQLQWNGHEHMGKTTLAGMITDGSRAPGAVS